jgi:uncharacterized protein (TIGR02246 family)
MSEDQNQSLIHRHLQAWRRGDVPALLADYTDDAVLLSLAGGAIVGKDAIGAMLEEVFATLFPPDDTQLDVTGEIMSGEHALIHWTASTSKLKTTGGFDAFVIRDGRIVAQSSGADIVALE